MKLRITTSGVAAILLLLSTIVQNLSFGQSAANREYLGAILPPELTRYAGVEVPSQENIAIRSDDAGPYLEFRLIPGQARKNNGIRAEVSVNYPFKLATWCATHGRCVSGGFQGRRSPEPLVGLGQWHDQPDPTQAKRGMTFPPQSAVSFNYVRLDGKDFLSLLVVSPKMTRIVSSDQARFLAFDDVVLKWSQGSDGKLPFTWIAQRSLS